jgi:uncharacterized membrane protein YphA (DoxX/SURF4 family)
MEFTYWAAVLVAAALFLVYGFLCLFSNGMEEEFERYGLSRFRRLTGGLEVLGGVGLLAGLFVTEVMLVASGGLALLMVLGIGARVRVRDPLVEMLPALVLLVMNVFIFATEWGTLGA